MFRKYTGSQDNDSRLSDNSSALPFEEDNQNGAFPDDLLSDFDDASFSGAFLGDTAVPEDSFNEAAPDAAAAEATVGDWDEMPIADTAEESVGELDDMPFADMTEEAVSEPAEPASGVIFAKKRPPAASQEAKRAASAKSPANIRLRLTVALCAILFGLGVIIALKVSNISSDDTVSLNDNPVSNVTPSDGGKTESAAEGDTSSDNVEYKELQLGDNGDDVLKMQQRLTELGYYDASSCTGFFGNYTKKRLIAFQQAAGLEGTGIADSRTLAVLYSDSAPHA